MKNAPCIIGGSLFYPTSPAAAGVCDETPEGRDEIGFRQDGSGERADERIMRVDPPLGVLPLVPKCNIGSVVLITSA